MRGVTKLAAIGVVAVIATATGVLPAAWNATASWVTAESGNLIALATGEPGPGQVPGVAAAGTPGDTSSFAFNSVTSAGDPVTWATCAPIPVVVNAAGAPAGAVDDVRAALDQVSVASGLTFTYAGTSDTAPSLDYGSAATADGWPPILVAWATPDTGLIGEGVAGRAYTTATGGHYVSGMVVINTALDAGRPGGFGQAGTRGAIYLHELAHVAGLGHVDDTGQLMHPNVPFAATFQAGDLAGLAALAPSGCA